MRLPTDLALLQCISMAYEVGTRRRSVQTVFIFYSIRRLFGIQGSKPDARLSVQDERAPQYLQMHSTNVGAGVPHSIRYCPS